METIHLETWLAAPPERCFDAARDLDLHMKFAAHTGERAIGGRTSGLIDAGEEVTWRARHLGVVQNFTSRITAFDRPRFFQDTMQRGAFRTFVHDHYFEQDNAGTCMVDVVAFSAPLGILGRMAEKLFLRAYLERFLQLRAATIKAAVEATILTVT